MASRKRHREGEDDELNLTGGASEPGEGMPEAKRMLLTDLKSGDDTVEPSEYAMEIVESLGTVSTKQQWTPFCDSCSVPDLLSLRRVCKLFHTLVGASFLSLHKFTLFPCHDRQVDEVLRASSAISSFRMSAERFTSIPSLQWPFSVVQSTSSVEAALEKVHAKTLHLNTFHPMPGNQLQKFQNVETLTVDFLMAFACFPPAPYQFITSLAILPPRDDLVVPYLNRLKQRQGLEIDLDPTDDGSIFLDYFCNTLLTNGFVSLQQLTISVKVFEEISLILGTLAQRELSTDFAKLTHLMLLTSPQFEVPNDIDLVAQILSKFPSLEELWLDSKIHYATEAESLDLAHLKRFQATIAGDPPACVCLSGSETEFLNLTMVEPSFVTLDPSSFRLLQALEVHSSLQAVSVLLSSLSGTEQDSSPVPVLQRLRFSAVMNQHATMESFEMPEILNLEFVFAHFISNSPGLPLSLSFAGRKLKELTLDVHNSVAVHRLAFDLNMTSLEKLDLGTSTNPRLSSRWTVEVPFLPPSITALRIPAHWTLCSGPSQLLPYASVREKLFLSSFDVRSPFDLQQHAQLQKLNIEILSVADSFLQDFSMLLPSMECLKECSLMLQASEVLPFNIILPIVPLQSKSLQTFSIKLLAPVWAKPTPQSTISGNSTRNPKLASALDPNLALGHVNAPPIPTGRSTCNVQACGCSGYTRDINRVVQVPNGTAHAAALPNCATIGCGHASVDHKPAADQQTRYLSISLNCPKLTRLAVAGLASIICFQELLRHSPLLTHLQVSLSHTPEHMTVAHKNLKILHLARLEHLVSLYMKLPNLIRLYVEYCPVLQILAPLPAPRLETVHLVSSSSISPDSRFALQRANKTHSASILMAQPQKNWFPDHLPRF